LSIGVLSIMCAWVVGFDRELKPIIALGGYFLVPSLLLLGGAYVTSHYMPDEVDSIV
jgi:hypothetical protein